MEYSGTTYFVSGKAALPKAQFPAIKKVGFHRGIMNALFRVRNRDLASRKHLGRKSTVDPGKVVQMLRNGSGMECHQRLFGRL
jgi:hypothetical protein